MHFKQVQQEHKVIRRMSLQVPKLQREGVSDFTEDNADTVSIDMVEMKKLAGETEKRVLNRISLEKNKNLTPTEIQLKKETSRQRRFAILNHVF